MRPQVDHIAGSTFHGRAGVVKNAFRYGIDYVMLNAEATSLDAPSCFGRNARGILSLWDCDHGGPVGQGRGAVWARDVLAQYGLAGVTSGALMLLAQPRTLGHVFNPVSFWVAYDDAAQIRAIIAEVTNTFGDRHCYLCFHDDHRPITRHDELHAKKIFHVSPFQDIAGDYRFRFDIRDDRIGIWIAYSANQNGVFATLTGTRRRLDFRGMIMAMIRRPLGARRVLALIHWQALKLWWKGAPYRARPVPPRQGISR